MPSPGLACHRPPACRPCSTCSWPASRRCTPHRPAWSPSPACTSWQVLWAPVCLFASLPVSQRVVCCAPLPAAAALPAYFPGTALPVPLFTILFPCPSACTAERYAHLTASMLLLHADFLDGPLDTNIDRLRYAGEAKKNAKGPGLACVCVPAAKGGCAPAPVLLRRCAQVAPALPLPLSLPGHLPYASVLLPPAPLHPACSDEPADPPEPAVPSEGAGHRLPRHQLCFHHSSAQGGWGGSGGRCGVAMGGERLRRQAGWQTARLAVMRGWRGHSSSSLTVLYS